MSKTQDLYRELLVGEKRKNLGQKMVLEQLRASGIEVSAQRRTALNHNEGLLLWAKELGWYREEFVPMIGRFFIF